LCMRELVVLRQLTQMPGDLYAPYSAPLPWSPLL
jgi:hypothetical protein